MHGLLHIAMALKNVAQSAAEISSVSCYANLSRLRDAVLFRMSITMIRKEQPMYIVDHIIRNENLPTGLKAIANCP